MYYFVKINLLLITLLLLDACSPSPKQDRAWDSYSDSLILSHAQNFKIYYTPNYKVVQVFNPELDNLTHTYYLGKKSKKAHESNYFQTPLKNLVCLSTSQLPHLIYLNAVNKLIGFPNPDHISSPEIRDHINSGHIQDIGSDFQVNMEALIMLNPEAVIGFETGNSSDQMNEIKNKGIPVIMNYDFLEKTPLGRAEWIKFFGAFLNKTSEADSIFTRIHYTYDSLKEIGKKMSKKKPVVMCGIMYGDAWYVPQGDSWVARFISDAGGEYIWKDSPGTGSMPLNFETVLELASKADIWINVGSYQSLKALKEADHKYTLFDAYKKKQVFGYTAKLGPKGGNQYHELGYLRPDLILADLIRIFHPDILAKEELYFYERLE